MKNLFAEYYGKHHLQQLCYAIEEQQQSAGNASLAWIEAVKCYDSAGSDRRFTCGLYLALVVRQGDLRLQHIPRQIKETQECNAVLGLMTAYHANDYEHWTTRLEEVQSLIADEFVLGRILNFELRLKRRLCLRLDYSLHESP